MAKTYIRMKKKELMAELLFARGVMAAAVTTYTKCM